MIPSILDNDLYKFTMMYAVWKKYPDARVTYEFINRRGSDRFTPEFLDILRGQIAQMGCLRLSDEEHDWLGEQEIFGADFLAFLKSFRLNPADVKTELSAEGALEITVEGLWVDTILWEVPLMALICEVYYQTVDTGWDHDLDHYYHKTLAKGIRMSDAGCTFADFGTRRRRSFETHQRVIQAFVDVAGRTQSGFVGTSNVHLARVFDTRPIGTMAHEWIMGHAGMFGVAGANRKALEAWTEVFGKKLLVALTDTYTTDLFLKEFRGELATFYDGIRHDSESPFHFGDRAVAFYEASGIDPMTKRIVFSDGLDVETAIEIQRYTQGRIGAVYGIGTHFTNDFEGSPALNIVIKMHAINGVQVAKISDAPGKASGDPLAVRQSLDVIERETGVKMDMK